MNRVGEPTVLVAEMADRLYGAQFMRWDGRGVAGMLDSYIMDFGGMLQTYRRHDHGWTQGEPTHLIVPDTTWGEFVGSVWQRSNHRSLLRDYPQYVKDVVGPLGSHRLVIPLHMRVSAGFVEMLVKLQESAIYDSEDEQALRWELAQAAWDDTERDLRLKVEEILVVAHGKPFPVAERITADVDLKKVFYANLDFESGEPYVCEDAVFGYFPKFDEIAAKVAAKLLEDH